MGILPFSFQRGKGKKVQIQISLAGNILFATEWQWRYPPKRLMFFQCSQEFFVFSSCRLFFFPPWLKSKSIILSLLKWLLWTVVMPFLKSMKGSLNRYPFGSGLWKRAALLHCSPWIPSLTSLHQFHLPQFSGVRIFLRPLLFYWNFLEGTPKFCSWFFKVRNRISLDGHPEVILWKGRFDKATNTTREEKFVQNLNFTHWSSLEMEKMGDKKVMKGG